MQMRHREFRRTDLPTLVDRDWVIASSGHFLHSRLKKRLSRVLRGGTALRGAIRAQLDRMGDPRMANNQRFSVRRALLLGGLSFLATPAAARTGIALTYAPSLARLRGYELGSLVVRLIERRLYLVREHAEAFSFPVAVPVPEFQRLGVTHITIKARSPSWFPTRRMRILDPSLPKRVPPGPANPLGPFALYLSWPNVRIHGNNDPTSVGKVVTSGCYRLYNHDIAFIYPRVSDGSNVYVEL